ncbi:MAG: aspartate--tRNA ligase [Erysipelotrichaceae bacterium]|nr:aspartate--tRNA ligase [Erysipelotrichaceae bacterium]
MERTHTNGALRLKDVNQTVVLVGWVAKRRNLGGLVFIDLRDRTGITQIICDESTSDSIKDVRNEYILQVYGIVRERKDKNLKLPTGAIEVQATKVTVINKAETTPIIIADETDALEDTRLKYRYLDLRRPVMQQKLFERAHITKVIRHFLEDNGFIEVETPILTVSTPEGARDFLVPSRVHPGSFYALPQSPQLFKQLLMVSGFERYFQFARCFRDEDLRADRQTDFTQVDIETSFLSEAEIQELMEDMMCLVMKEVKGLDIARPFLKLPYFEAMNRYGSDKPDIRFGLELQDITDIFKESAFSVFNSIDPKKGTIKALVLPNMAESSRKDIDQYTAMAKKYGAKGLVTIKYQDSILEGSAIKFFNETEKDQLINRLGLHKNDLILIIAGDWEKSCEALGALRNYFGKELKLYDPEIFSFLWVVDFPLLEYSFEDQRYYAKHHPFTRPKEEDIPLLDTDPSMVKAAAYDMVLNGFELGGGSLRIYDQSLQAKMFGILGFTPEDIKRRFGWFIDAFQYGTPPHGGLAFGLDRIAMILTHSESLRDVIAFPKTASASCPLTNAPTPVDQKQLDELSIILKDHN